MITKKIRERIYLRKHEIEKMDNEKISGFIKKEKIIILTESEIRKREKFIEDNFSGKERRSFLRMFFSKLYDFDLKNNRINIPRKMLKKP